MTASTIDNTLAFVFPGQGSQSVGMLAGLGEQYPQVSEVFARAGDVLGYDLWQLVQGGPEADLNRTDRTQPAMLAAGVAVWQVWRARNGAAPAMMAGHSLGEYTALVCAGALPFDAAVALVAARGRCMQEAVPDGVGAMAAILGLDDETVIDVCRRAADNEVVEAVNFNSPGQVVIAGNAAAVERATVLAKEAGAKRAVTLPVSVPSHCSLMRPAAEKYAEVLSAVEISKPGLPVIQNVDAVLQDEAGLIRENLERQLYRPVQWVSTIRTMQAHGITGVIEAGPGKVLAGLGKRIDRSVGHAAVHDPASLDAALGGE